MSFVGRKAEFDQLDYLCSLNRPQFVAVYGRRRVGKTRLVREYFHNQFSFYATGVARGDMSDQLQAFSKALAAYGTNTTQAKDWFDAFAALITLLESETVHRDPATGRRIIFIDELPWLDSSRSRFLPALDWFWNSWGSAHEDVFLIVCGSATSWIIEKLFKNHGGLHNRVTARLHIDPLSLGECEKLCEANGMNWSRERVMEAYMIFGGIPFYLELFDRRMSLAQSVDVLCFAHNGQLHGEFDELFHSLFRKADDHVRIVRALAGKGMGLTREQIVAATGITSGGGLTTVLEELDQCGFIRAYRGFGNKKKETLYQLIDPFTLFWLRFVEGQNDELYWEHNLQGVRVRTWRGYAFELICLLHTRQLLQALGIAAIASDVSSWRSRGSDPGAQIDLVIDRADGIINLCEMKWSEDEFAITKSYDRKLRSKVQAFIEETHTHKSPQITLVTPVGVKQNAYRWTAESVVTAEELFS